VETTDSDLKGEMVRRVMHVCVGAVLLFYFLPHTLIGVPTWIYLVMLFVALPVCIEIIRLNKKTLFLGLREYEKSRVASYVWFTIGATLLILFFPQQIAAPCILATAFGDPAIGVTKKLRRRYTFSIAIIIIFLIFLAFDYILILAIFAAGVTFIAQFIEFKIQWRVRKSLFWSRSKHEVSEYRKYFDFLFKTDDDFMMQIMPAIVLFILFLIQPDLMPDTLLEPLEQLAFLK
jgi:dolichol kinase